MYFFRHYFISNISEFFSVLEISLQHRLTNASRVEQSAFRKYTLYSSGEKKILFTNKFRVG
jgi:hypothetical protein